MLSQSDPLRQRCSRDLQECEPPDRSRRQVAGRDPGRSGPRRRCPGYLELASLCQLYKNRHVAAVRFYAQAFTVDPKVAEDLSRDPLYTAAYRAALAAAGQGEDA